MLMARDLISNLPDDVLGKILSLTPTKVAASTSVLSKRWRNLLPLALVDSLDFDESMLYYPEEATSRRHGFSDFVDKTLALVINSSLLIKKFSLICDYENDKSRVNRWIRTALELGCLELNLKSGVDLRIDFEFFTSDTLVKLTITKGFYPAGRLPSGGVFFPALKTLSLVSVWFSSRVNHNLFIHGCPVLEELFIYDWMGYLSSPCVKRVITCDFDDKFYISGLNLKTHSLVYLDYSSYVAGDYNFSLDSLVEARLDIRLHKSNIYDDDGPIYGNVRSLINGMSNIKSLHLSCYSLEEMKEQDQIQVPMADVAIVRLGELSQLSRLISRLKCQKTRNQRVRSLHQEFQSKTERIAIEGTTLDVIRDPCSWRTNIPRDVFLHSQAAYETESGDGLLQLWASPSCFFHWA